MRTLIKLRNSFITIAMGLLITGTALAIDTDRDTLPDDWEIAHGHNPLQADYQIELGTDYSCAMVDDGVQCWGASADGQGSAPALENPVQVSVGRSHACAIDDSGVHCWGQNDEGQASVPALVNPVQVSVGLSHTCAIDDNGVHCWGYNSNNTTTPIPALSNPVQISASGAYTCAIDDSGVHCWGGYNFEGQLNVPVLVNPVQVSAGRFHVCAIDDSGVHCWGYNSDGQLNVPALVNPVQVSAGQYHTCALDDNGVKCWGANNYGQRNVPVLNHPVQISAGDDHSCALDDTGVHCWGYDTSGSVDDIPNLAIDPDGDGINNAQDTFPLDNTQSGDMDGDSIDNNIDTDIDGDGFEITDNCPLVANVNQLDTDGDGIGDVCDSNRDNDYWYNAHDNCPLLPNDDQLNFDGDSFGNVCDTDIDGDGTPNDSDNCPIDWSSNQSDMDGDGAGDICDAFPNDPTETLDSDYDMVGDNSDNCPVDWNYDQENFDADSAGDVCDAFPEDETETLDTDGDGTGNNTDTDDDDDGMLDAWEILHGLNPLVQDAYDDLDGDGVRNGIDLFPDDATQSGIDTDSDGFDNAIDNCPVRYNPDQVDSDSNGIGEACDVGNYDGDDFSNIDDLCYLVPSGGYDSDFNVHYQWDRDNDHIGDECDPDIDGDSILNASDNCPDISNVNQLNTDGDTMGNACDYHPYDTDNDYTNDDVDAFPNDPTETVDTDHDGIGNNTDTDDDNDGVLDLVFCSMENETCVFEGAREVYYGARGEYMIRTFTDGVACSNDSFYGDPITGVVKSCYLSGGDAFPLDPNESADTDHDGIGDNGDNCPSQANVYGYGIDTNGCPIPPPDTDGDGYNDLVDACPAQADVYGFGVDATGCPILPPDADDDGYPDSVDVCPNNGDQGYGVDGNGCPIPAPVKNDFNADGKADLLLRNTTTGEWNLASLNGLVVLNQSTVGAFSDIENVIVSTANFDGDRDADILTRGTDNGLFPGTFHIDLMSGATVTGSAWLFTMPIDLNDEVMSTKDFNKDGKADVLLRNKITGVWKINYMNGANDPTTATLNASTDLCYTMKGDGDYDGNGYPDILLRRDACGGASYSWLINTTDGDSTILASGVPTGVSMNTAWGAVVTDKDFNGDGKDDVLIRALTGSVQQWLLYDMNGTAAPSASGLLNLAVQSMWQFATDADFNGDGKDDIVLRSVDTGQWYGYLLDGRTLLGNGVIAMAMNPIWTLQALDDNNGDGKADILLRNSASGQWWLYLMNGLAIQTKAALPITMDLSYTLQNN